MRNRASQAGVGEIDVPSKEPRNVLLVVREDGTFSVFENEVRELRKYRPKKGETVSFHRAFVR